MFAYDDQDDQEDTGYGYCDEEDDESGHEFQSGVESLIKVWEIDPLITC